VLGQGPAGCAVGYLADGSGGAGGAGGSGVQEVVIGGWARIGTGDKLPGGPVPVLKEGLEGRAVGAVPFQCTIRVRSATAEEYSPTAQALLADSTATPLRMFGRDGPPGFGG
jgi:hypothetical protein